MAHLKITDIITKEDLGDPYDRLSEFLDLDDIIKLEQEYSGRTIKFRRNCKDAEAEYPELISMLGLKKAKKVIRELGGMSLYFPTLKRNTLNKIKNLIIEESNGYNHSFLAKKFGYSERHINRIIAKKNQSSEVYENQMTIFDLYSKKN